MLQPVKRIVGASRVTELAMKAKEIFETNVNTLVAMFLIRHPDIDPADVILRIAPGAGGKMDFSIEPKGLHVPEERYRPLTGPEHDQVQAWTSAATPAENNAYDTGFVDGWNSCRLSMIASTEAAIPFDSMNTPLSDSIDSMFMPEDEPRVEENDG
jgi:hypothetical protein